MFVDRGEADQADQAGATFLLPDGSYVVGTSGEQTVGTGQRNEVVLTLNDVGKYIRSVYPDYDFLTRATFTTAGGEKVVVEQLSPAS